MRIEPQPSNLNPTPPTTLNALKAPENGSQSYSGQGGLQGQEPFDQLAAVGWGEGNLTLAPRGLRVQGLDFRIKGLGRKILV